MQEFFEDRRDSVETSSGISGLFVFWMILSIIWFIAGISAFIASLVCFALNGSFTDKTVVFIVARR